MSDLKAVLLLPGPSSVESARQFFGTAYEYQSYLADDFVGNEHVAAVTNGALKSLAGRNVDVWQVPQRLWSPHGAGLESILRHLLKLKCTIRLVAVGVDDEQLEPGLMAKLGMPAAQVMEWARGRIRKIESIPDPEAEPVPRETELTRGTPRSKVDGSPPVGTQIEGNTGSVFVSWERLGLESNSNGVPHPHLANIQRILSGHPQLVGRVWYDEFHEKVFQTLFQPEPDEWQDAHDIRLTVWIQVNLRLSKIGHQLVRAAIDDYARQDVRNEVREWMDGLKWDGHERLPTFMAKGFGAEQNEYTADVGRCWFVSMAARTYEPGCKVDTMPVFEGKQGQRKSSALAIIGGKWFTEMHEDITSKDFLQNLRGKLLIEIPELHAFKRAGIHKIKGIISNPKDRYRESYGRRAADRPRRSVWSGTTNEDNWVEDDTGARRFWPIACGKIDHQYITERRDQLFAEAVVRFKAGEPWWNINEELARREQDARREEDVWAPTVNQYLSERHEVTIGEILNLVLEIPLRERGKTEQMRVASILRLAGFERRQVWRGKNNTKLWIRNNP